MDRAFKLNTLKFQTSDWLDKIKEYRVKFRRRDSVIAFLTLSVICLATCTSILAWRLLDGIDSQRLVLVPGLQRKIYVPAEAYLSEAFIQGVSSKVVDLQENWNHITIRGKYKELADWYYDDALENRVSTNLVASKRFDYVEQHLMASEFQIDLEKSKFSWCKKLNRACSLVVGTRKLYLNRNDLHSEREVAYLLITKGVYPDEDNPTAVRFTRVKINDTADSPYELMLRQYQAALKGVMPDA